MNQERYFGMSFKEQFPINIINQCIRQLTKYFHELWSFEVHLDFLIVTEMFLKQSLQIIYHQLCHDFKGLMDINGLNDACNVVEVLIEYLWC